MKQLFLILLLGGTISAQITVSQQFVDDSNQAFKDVVVLREANKALVGANNALIEANNRNATAVTALLEANTILKGDNADLRKLKCDETKWFFSLIKTKRCK